MFLWNAKVSPFDQINGDQLRRLTVKLMQHCERNGSKVHSGTFVLCTGETNFLAAIEQTFTGSTISRPRIIVPANDMIPSPKYDKSIPAWKRKKLENNRLRKMKRLPSRFKQRYIEFDEPLSLRAKRVLLRKPKTKPLNPVKRLFNRYFASYNQPPRMVLLPYEATVLPEEDIIEINGDNLEDEDMTEEELLRSIVDEVINGVIKENPATAVKKHNVYLNKDYESGKLYSFHEKRGKKLMQRQVLSDQNLTEERLQEMNIFQLELQVQRLTGNPPQYKGIKKVEKLSEKKRKMMLLDEIDVNISSRTESFYENVIKKRTAEIEEEINQYDRPLVIDIVGIYTTAFYINKKWHLAIKLNSCRREETKIAKRFIAAESIRNRTEVVPEDAYDFFCFLMLEVKNLAFHIGKMITGFQHKLLLLGWNKWLHTIKSDKIQEQKTTKLGYCLVATLEKSCIRPPRSRSFTPQIITKMYPYSNYKYTWKMYCELKKLSILHAHQFSNGLIADLKKYGHRNHEDANLEYRLGREYYLTQEQTATILKESEIALPVIISKPSKTVWCAMCCERKKRGSIAASRNKNPVTDFANANCPGPVATLVEKLCIFFAFVTWVICNCWKTPFFLYGYCSGLCMNDKDWRRTRRQIQRVEKLEKERVAFNKLTAKKRKLKRLQMKEEKKWQDDMEKGLSAGASKTESF